MAVAARLRLASENPLALIMLSFGGPVVRVLFGALVARSTWDWFITPLGPRPITYGEAVGVTLTALFVIVYVRGFTVLVPTTTRKDVWAGTKSVAMHVAALAMFWVYAAGFHAILR